jgi:hypothetical protein
MPTTRPARRPGMRLLASLVAVSLAAVLIVGPETLVS